MDKQIYKRAQARIEKLRFELARLEEFVSTYDLLAGEVERCPDARAEGQEARAHCEDVVDKDADREMDAALELECQRATPQEELERIVVRLIETHGAPLRRLDLFRRVKAEGVVVGGRKELTNFGSKLSRAESLTNLPKLGYWPKNRPYEAAGYFPEEAAGKMLSLITSDRLGDVCA
jgi:hypothetical protein